MENLIIGIIIGFTLGFIAWGYILSGKKKGVPDMENMPEPPKKPKFPKERITKYQEG